MARLLAQGVGVDVRTVDELQEYVDLADLQEGL